MKASTAEVSEEEVREMKATDDWTTDVKVYQERAEGHLTDDHRSWAWAGRGQECRQ